MEESFETITRKIKPIAEEVFPNKLRNKIPPISQFICTRIPFPIDVGYSKLHATGQRKTVPPSGLQSPRHNNERGKSLDNQIRITLQPQVLPASLMGHFNSQ